MRSWELIGVPYTSMARPGGIQDAIGVLRSEGLAERLASVGVRDRGDLPLQPPSGERGQSGIVNEPALSALVRATRDAVGRSISRGVRPLLVGGDCPVLLGPLAGIADGGERCGLVMLDGHEDAWSPSRSETGEASDSEVAIAIGSLGATLPEPLDELVPLIEPAHLAVLGPRDAAEIAAGGEASIRDDVALFLDDAGVEELGGAATAAAALEAIGDVAFWLHVDLDVLATRAFAAVDYPQPGGITWSELDAAFVVASSDPRCRGASVAIYNPDRDPHRSEARKVIDFLGRTIAPSPPRRGTS